MEAQIQSDPTAQQRAHAANLFQDIIRLVREPACDEMTVQILVALGDLYRMRTFPPPPQLEDWKRLLTRDTLDGAIACVMLSGPQGLFVYPDEVSLPADVDMSILNRDRLQSFMVALTRITMHRVELLRGEHVAQLEQSREAFDTWLGRVIFPLRLSPLEIDAKRGDRILIEREPAWASYVCYSKRPVNPNGGHP